MGELTLRNDGDKLQAFTDESSFLDSVQSTLRGKARALNLRTLATETLSSSEHL